MTADAPGTRGNRVRELRGAMGTLLADLHGCARDGRVTEDDFSAATAALELDTVGLKRLELALAQQGLMVERAVAPTRESVRVGRVLGLARKYAAAGVVPAPAFTGLVSLCGLDTAERELLTVALRGEGVVIGAIPLRDALRPRQPGRTSRARDLGRTNSAGRARSSRTLTRRWPPRGPA